MTDREAPAWLSSRELMETHALLDGDLVQMRFTSDVHCSIAAQSTYVAP